MSGARATVRGVVLDLDGTLVDGSADITRAMNGALVAVGAAPVTVQAVGGWLGGGPRALVARCLGGTGGRPGDPGEPDVDLVEEVLERYSAAYRADPCSQTVLLGDGAAALAGLARAGVRLGICTNKRTAIAEQVLAGLDVRRHLGSVVGSDTTATPKPHPGHLLEVVDALGLTPPEVLYVGDTEIDARTAAAAGVRYAHVAWGHGDVAADLRLASLLDLLDLPDLPDLPA